MHRTLLLLPRLLGALLAMAALDPAAEPEHGFAAVVHPSNPARDIHLRDLTSLFEGANRHWPNSSLVVLVERDATSAPYQYLMSRLLNTTAIEYKRHLQNIEYRGETPLAIKVLNSDAAACQFVFNVPTAIAIVETKSLGSPACALIQVLRIDGKMPGQEGYRLK
jgi:hypothetical protein